MIRTANRRALTRLAMIVPLLSLMGCAQKQTTVTIKTPAQRVAVYNGTLAELNKAATAGVIGLQKSGVLTVAQALVITDYTLKVATASKSVATIQQNPGDWLVMSKQIQNILGQLPLPANVSGLISGPQAAQVLSIFTSLQVYIQQILKEVL